MLKYNPERWHLPANPKIMDFIRSQAVNDGTMIYIERPIHPGLTERKCGNWFEDHILEELQTEIREVHLNYNENKITFKVW